MIPAAAATVSFALFAGAGLVWALRRDVTRRAPRKRAGGDAGDTGAYVIAYGSEAESPGCDSGSPGGGDCGGD